MAAETELKFRVENVASLRAQARSVGLDLQTPSTFESNTLYDTPERMLRARTEILRIRQYGDKWVLTHKRLPDEAEAQSRFKTRVETETEIGDGEALAEIFKRLGYGPVFRYEKYREEWAAAGGHLVIDETPIGVWAELEGDPGWIDTMLAQLAIPSGACSTMSYGTLFLEWKQATGSPAENLTFEEIQPAAANP